VLAEYDHLKWVQRLVAALEGDELDLPRDEIANPRACRFGRWYEHEGRSQYGHLRAFADIDPLHQRIHAMAHQMIELRDAGDAAAARQHAEEIHRLKDAIVDRLGSMHGVLLERPN
jgi:hypothetical protein